MAKTGTVTPKRNAGAGVRGAIGKFRGWNFIAKLLLRSNLLLIERIDTNGVSNFANIREDFLQARCEPLRVFPGVSLSRRNFQFEKRVEGSGSFSIR